jgi:hypothetical protein
MGVVTARFLDTGAAQDAEQGLDDWSDVLMVAAFRGGTYGGDADSRHRLRGDGGGAQRTFPYDHSEFRLDTGQPRRVGRDLLGDLPSTRAGASNPIRS